MRVIASLARALWRDRRGATMVEYGLLIALIALAMLASFGPVASRVVGFWHEADADVTEATAAD